MNGYLTFLRNLTEYQQKAEIGRIAFIGGVFNCAVEEDILKDQTVIAFSEMLEVDPRSWEFDLAPFSFRYGRFKP